MIGEELLCLVWLVFAVSLLVYAIRYIRLQRFEERWERFIVGMREFARHAKRLSEDLEVLSHASRGIGIKKDTIAFATPSDSLEFSKEGL